MVILNTSFLSLGIRKELFSKTFRFRNQYAEGLTKMCKTHEEDIYNGNKVHKMV